MLFKAWGCLLLVVFVAFPVYADVRLTVLSEGIQAQDLRSG